MNNFSVSGPGWPPGVRYERPTRPTETIFEYILAAAPVAPGTLKIFVPGRGQVDCAVCMRPTLVPGPLGVPHEPLVIVVHKPGEFQFWCRPCWDRKHGDLRLWEPV